MYVKTKQKRKGYMTSEVKCMDVYVSVWFPLFFDSCMLTKQMMDILKRRIAHNIILFMAS